LNGKGEKGNVSIIVNSDGSGNSGENSGVNIQLQKSGDMPVEFTYTAPVFFMFAQLCNNICS